MKVPAIGGIRRSTLAFVAGAMAVVLAGGCVDQLDVDVDPGR